MSMLTTHAERHPVDLSRFAFHAGFIGRLKVLDTTLVQPGDSFECDMVGSFSLSPLRRGLALDTKLDIFSFYIPLRYCTERDGPNAFVDLVKAGPNSGLKLSNLAVSSDPVTADASYLGVHANVNGAIPAFLHEAYIDIYNNYFKTPEAVDLDHTSVAWMNDTDKRGGLPCAHLKSYWTAPLPAEYTNSQTIDTSAGSFDLADFALNAGHLQAIQERALFAHRYRDIVDMLGGSAPVDTDKRPQLIQRTQSWASGYDVNGTDSTSMGQFSGRIQQTFNHKVPRFFCREHGIVMTLMLPRFPPVHHEALDPMVGFCGELDYEFLVHDPAYVGVAGDVQVPMSRLFVSGSGTNNFPMAAQQWHRVPAPDYVDARYWAVEGFPFLTEVPLDAADCLTIESADYDSMFQSDVLHHWNVQMKTNVEVSRLMITTRDTLMNDD